MQTRSAADQLSLQALLDSVTRYQGPAQGDFAKATVGVLMCHYKVEDETILRTTALAM
jgi:hypothetical protein